MNECGSCGRTFSTSQALGIHRSRTHGIRGRHRHHYEKRKAARGEAAAADEARRAIAAAANEARRVEEARVVAEAEEAIRILAARRAEAKAAEARRVEELARIGREIPLPPDDATRYCGCGETFPTRARLNYHQTFVCPLIPLIESEPLKSDQRGVAAAAAAKAKAKDGPNPLACPYQLCDYVATDVDDRNTHVRFECWHRPDAEPEPTCPDCGNEFPTVQGMRTHRRTHAVAVAS